MTITVYGIKNCSTVKKALSWLDDHKIACDFYDYKKQGVDRDVLEYVFEIHVWEAVINRRGMTWRNLPDTIKNTMDRDKAIDIAIEKPSIIKRPLIAKGDTILLGFDPKTYKETLL